MGTFQRMYSTHSTQHSASLTTVERAQPLLPQFRTSTKNRSPPMFSTELIIRKYSGTFAVAQRTHGGGKEVIEKVKIRPANTMRR